MIKRSFFLAFCILAITCSIYFVYDYPGEKTAKNEVFEPNTNLEIPEEDSHKLNAQAAPLSSIDTSADKTEAEYADLANSTISREQLGAQVDAALESYAEFSRYPPNSQPILNQAHVHSFVNTSTPVSEQTFALPNSDKSIKARISLDKYNHHPGGNITGWVKLSDMLDNASISATLSLNSLQGDVLLTEELAELNTVGEETQLQFMLDTTLYEVDSWPYELSLGLTLDINGDTLYLSTPLRMNPHTAELSEVGFSQVVNEYLKIPVVLNVHMEGYYHVAAVLSSAEDAKPLVHLETEGYLKDGFSELALNAHIRALKKNNHPGPYQLTHIRIERWSDEAIPLDVSAFVPNQYFPVNGYDFDDYQDKEYRDPLAEERLRLLQGLSAL